MALPADNFDSYGTGGLAGNNGGTGWGGAWTNGVNDNWTVENTVFQSSPNGVSAAADGTDRFIYRVMASAQSSGVQGVYMRLAGTAGFCDFQLNNGNYTGGTAACYIRMDGSDNLIAYGPSFGSSVTGLASYAANTWYLVEIDFDCATDDYRIRVDGGTWTSRIGFVNGALTTLDRVVLHNSDNGGATRYIDTIYDATPVASAIKTIDGLARASVKTVDGLAIASVKTWNGLA